MPRATRPRLVIALVCGLLVVGGLTALVWGRSHQYEAPSLTSPSTASLMTTSPQETPSTVPASRPASARQAAQQDVAAPSSLSIARLGLDEKLLPLGLDAHGALAVPEGRDVHRVAWYRGSPRPGQAGPAVIEGHVVTPDGAGPFRHLGTLRAGDAIAVRDAAQQIHTFSVYRVAQYAKNDFPTAEVYANTPDAELRLITCSGAFDARTGHYDSNTVVYAR